MKLLRDLGHDLVDKRLWPLAALLVIALIAIPVVLKSSPAPVSGKTAPGTTSSAASGPADLVSAVALDRPERSRLRLGSPRDVFSQPFKSGTTPTATGSGTATPTGGGSSSQASGGSSPSTSASGSAGGTGSASTGDAGTPSTGDSGSSGGEQPASGTPTWTFDGRFGPIDAMKALKAVPVGKGVPSNEEPLLIFAGVSKDGKRAIFLPSSDAVPEADGDGECSPSPEACRTLTLEIGGNQVFDVASQGGLQQYVLELDKLAVRSV